MDEQPATEPRQEGERFLTTRWSQVLAVRSADRELASAALRHLCETYWPALYAYARRKGAAHADAEDLVQGFFARLIEKRDLHAERGAERFRSYLLGAFRNFAANQDASQRSVRRGGRERVVSIDELTASRVVEGLAAHDSPEQAYERQFALGVLDSALRRLRDEQCAGGRQVQFDTLRPLLGLDEHATSYAEAAERLATTQAALRVAVHRLKRRLAHHIRAELAGALARPEDLEAELLQLLAALRR